MKKAVIVLFVLSTIITFYSCGSKTTNEHEYVLDSESVEEEVVEDLPKFPLIDFEGVGEIKIGSYVSNILSKSSFYDKIIINKIYSATLGDHGVYLSENELEKYKDDPYVDVDGELLEGIVKNGNDTMIIFRSSNSNTIDEIEIYSPNLKFENGIGVGLRTDELCSNYNASILSTDLWAGTYAMWYDIPNFPSNVGLYLAKNKLDEMNIFEYVDGTGIMIPKGGELIREEEDGHSPIYRVSKSLVENSYIEYIIIREKSKVNTVRSESSFADKDSEIDDDTDISKINAQNKIKGHEYVDLGLSVKWATCNVGASQPHHYGNYYAWGETSTKSEYTEEKCRTFKNMSDISGNSSYDAACANWGGSWRMPTKQEMEELKYKCTWKKTTQSGVEGFRVTGPNGNSIFLPAAGYCNRSSRYDVGEDGYYWSSTFEGGNVKCAYFLEFHIFGSFYSVDHTRCYYKLTVRPVSE
ncbi:MAG: hypothetical protein J6V54_07570 [Bacteroidales bacterium]|nr:hypothetical protein [Bacteroidales bacterium]